MAIEHALFDLNGTLLDPAAMTTPLGPEGAGLSDAILGDTVLLAMAETLRGSYRDFGELLRIAAARRLELAGIGDRLDELIAGVGEMRPFPEAAKAISTLRSAGIGAGVLTNSSTATAKRLIGASGLELDPIVGTDSVRAFKPDRRVYERGLEVLDLPAARVVLFSVHSWDVAGARAAGLKAAWVARKEGLPTLIEGEPDFRGKDLAAVAAAVAAGRRS